MVSGTMALRKRKVTTKRRWEGFWTPELKRFELRKERTLDLMKKNNIPASSVLGKHLLNLSSSDLGIRGSAIKALEGLSGLALIKPIIPKVILPVLIKSLNDPDPVIREEFEKAIKIIKKRAA